MTKATRDTTKLNFITDQGSTRATVRCACRALRLDDAFFGRLRGGVPADTGPPIPPIPPTPVPPTPVPATPVLVAALSLASVFPAAGAVVPGVRGVVALFALVPVLR